MLTALMQIIMCLNLREVVFNKHLEFVGLYETRKEQFDNYELKSLSAGFRPVFL